MGCAHNQPPNINLSGDEGLFVRHRRPFSSYSYRSDLIHRALSILEFERPQRLEKVQIDGVKDEMMWERLRKSLFRE